MRTRSVTALCLALAFLAAPAARAGGDDPIPYPDEEEPGSPRRNLPRKSDPSYVRPEETAVERGDREETLAGLDDPNIGLAFELLSGAMLVESARGQIIEARFGWGGRFTWEFGRILGSELLREALFADLTWSLASMRDGTAQVYDDTNYHYFTVAPAWNFPLGQGSPFGFYLQAGFGLVYQYSALHIGTAETQLSGLKPALQYGLGFRAGPRLYADAPFRISFRVEFTRFRRGYMDDNFLGGSLGVAF